MIKSYKLKKINNLLVYGSANNSVNSVLGKIRKFLPNKTNAQEIIHPKEIERRERLGTTALFEDICPNFPFSEKLKGITSYANSALIISGDCGFAFSNLQYWTKKLEEFNKALVDNDTFIFFIRGEYDEPQLFKDEAISLSNIKTIQDYSVISLATFDCLCIGGGISLDREWKKNQEKRIEKKLYWEDEGFVYDEAKINEALDKFNIGCIVTNVSPSFTFPGTNQLNKNPWTKNDDAILKESVNERIMVDKIYQHLVEKNKKPFVWFYSKYKAHNENCLNDILFFSIGKGFFSFNELVKANFNIDLKTKATNNSTNFVDIIEKKLEEIETLDWLDAPAVGGEEALDEEQEVEAIPIQMPHPNNPF